MKLRILGMVLGCLLAPTMIAAQQTGNATSTVAAPSIGVPRFINYSATARDVNGKPLTGTVGVTFALYTDQAGGSPIWLETQNVQADIKGHYTVMLGASQSSGLPLSVFTSTDARWLGVQVAGQSEDPRTLILSVPYALKAGDAETIGGLPPSAFLLAPAPTAGAWANAASPSGVSPVGTSPSASASPLTLGGGGTLGFIPLWTPDGNTLGNSVLFQSGSGATVKVGINTGTPSTTLDVKGPSTFRGALSLPATATANATAGKNSQPMKLSASAFNSGTSAAVNQNFQWQAEPLNNNTSSPSGTLNLLFGSGAGQPAETGLKVSNTGVLTFATGQTFPGSGTISGVTAGPGLTGGGTNGNVTVALTGSCGLGQILQWNSLTWICSDAVTGVTAGTDLIGTGSVGNITLSVDTSRVPQLAAANIFTGNQTVNGNLSATGLLTGSAYNIGSDLFAYGSSVNHSALLGFAGSGAANYQDTAVGWRALYSDTGSSNTAIGAQALYSDTTGYQNVASGEQALTANTTGYNNTANGGAALFSNTTGYYNTASGEGALFFNTTGAFNTAMGTIALASNTTGAANTASGEQALNANTIGVNNTADGTAALVLNSTGSHNTASGYQALWSSTTGSYNTASGEQALFQNTTGSNNTALGYLSGPDSFHPNLVNSTAIGANAQVTASNALVLGSINGVNGATASTNVGIGTTAPAFTLDVHGTGNFTGPITFAAGQTFPGAGTIAGVTAGTDLTGGGSSGTVTLSVDTTKVVTGVVAGTDLTGGGTGGVQTLSLDTTKVPQLNAANAFNGNQTVTGNVTATGGITGSIFSIGSNLFAFGSFANENSFQGFAGNFLGAGIANTGTGVSALAKGGAGVANTATGALALTNNTDGSNNTAEGVSALAANSTGSHNTASGTGALDSNTTGNFNTAVGESAIGTNLTGSSNTAIGYSAGPQVSSLSNSTAIGANASVASSNAMVLGSINGINNATADTLVGIGTTVPTSTLDIEATAAAGSAPTLLLKNKAPFQSGTTGNSVDIRFAPDGGSSVTNPNAYLRVQEDGNSQYGAFMSFATIADGGAGTGALERLRITASGNIGIGTASPDALLSVNGSADKPGGGSWGTFSDGRLKNLHGDFNAGLSQILKLHPVRYSYKKENAMGISDSAEHVGFVAQDVQKVIPEAVTQNDKGYLLVNNDPILWTMLNAIKEQQRQIREQRAQINTQRQQIARLSGKVGVLESALRTVNQAGRSTAQMRLANRARRLSSGDARSENPQEN